MSAAWLVRRRGAVQVHVLEVTMSSEDPAQWRRLCIIDGPDGITITLRILAYHYIDYSWNMEVLSYTLGLKCSWTLGMI